jgi:hypothetical protein
LKISKDTVQRIWHKAGLKRIGWSGIIASDDPDFERKAADIIGLYLSTPQHAAVFCVDEKSAIQALDRLDPVLRMPPGRIERHGFEYYRHGTLSRYAALDVRTGKVQGQDGRAAYKVEFIPRQRGAPGLNQVEIWFWRIEGEVIARGVFRSVRDLAGKLMRYIRAYSKTAPPFKWKYSDVRRRVPSC